MYKIISYGEPDIDITSLNSLDKAYMRSHQKPADYDLDWDDYESRREYMVLARFRYPMRLLLLHFFDGAIVYQWLLGTLKPGETKILHFVYAAGDTLDELEKNIAQGFKIASTVRQ
ncbi:MAG: hypothetical protein N3F64_05540 [Nitrososphaeria archaeon]|nr:hypothetical protein [Nitrososphaeria archaeon]